MPIVEAKNLGKIFFDNQVLQDLSFKIEDAEFVCLLGPSGSGKSTLLRILAGLETVDSGKLTSNILSTEKCSFVFQEATLLSWRSALENVSLPLELAGIAKQEREARAKNELTSVGLQDSLNLYPRQLSGGMKMRASIARGLVQRPKLLLMDEPFSALDEQTRFQLQDKTRTLFEQSGSMSIVFVTHSLSEALFLSDRILMLTPKGRLAQNEVVRLPKNRTSALRFQDEYFSELQRLQELQKSSYNQ